MYKKINHHIVEEHFDHPAVLPPHIKEKLADLGLVGLGPTDELPYAVMNESTLVFRMDSRSAWAKYAWSLLNYSISMNAQLPGTAQVETRLLRAATALGDFIIPYYGITAGNALGDKLAAIAKVGAEVVDAVRDERSLDEFQTIWADLIEDLAVFLNELNPSNWPKVLITELFTNLVTTWSDAIRARYNEEWDDNEMALDNLNKLVVTGIADHANMGFSSIADVFSRGIIAQYPSLFVK
jgi:hypothetical protein